MLREIGEHARALGLTQVALFTDPRLVQAGHVHRAEHALEAADVRVLRFDRCVPEPTTEDVARAAAWLSDQPDVAGLVALGGGSVIDTAKAANMVHTNGGAIADHIGPDALAAPLLPLIAVPTTAGTGSEMQRFTLIKDAQTHRKLACGAPDAKPRVVLLDPSLCLSMPAQTTALSGLDALVHTVETAVTKPATPASRALSARAFAILQRALPTVLATPHDLAARGAMLQAASWAGEAIDASMLGAAHATGNALTAVLGHPHGAAVARMAPHVVRLNNQDPASCQAYGALAFAAQFGTTHPAATVTDPGEAIALRLESLWHTAGGPGLAPALPSLSPSLCQALVEESLTQWTGTFNPVPLTPARVRALFEAAFAAQETA